MKRYKGHPYKIINNTVYVFRNEVDYLIGRASLSLCYAYSNEIEIEQKQNTKR